MKVGWEIRKLGDVCELMNGYAFQSKQYTDEGYFVIRIGNVQDGYIELNNPRYIKLKEEKQKKFILQSGDILISLTGNVGRVGAIQEEHLPAVLNQRVAKIAIKKEQRTDKEFLLYFLSSEYFISELIKAGRGAAQQNISTTDIESLEIPLPPLPVQQRIITILDEAFAAIAKAKTNAEQNLKNAKELFESYLQGVFENKGEGWEHIRLGDICQVNDGTHFSPKNSSYGDYMYITAKNIKPYYIDLTKISFISEKDHKEIYSRCSPIKGDVLYIKDGATAGIATINTIEEEFSLLSSVALLKCSSKILNTFLVHFMNSTIGKKNFLGYIGGAAITRLTLIKIKNVCFYLPPIKEQILIVETLDNLLIQTQRLELIYQKKLTDLEELKKSILQKAFNGELNTKEICA